MGEEGGLYRVAFENNAGDIVRGFKRVVRIPLLLLLLFNIGQSDHELGNCTDGTEIKRIKQCICGVMFPVWRQINNTQLQVEDMRARQKRNRRDIIGYAIKTSRRFTLLSDRGDSGHDGGSGQPAFLAHPKAVLGGTKREGQREW